MRKVLGFIPSTGMHTHKPNTQWFPLTNSTHSLNVLFGNDLSPTLISMNRFLINDVYTEPTCYPVRSSYTTVKIGHVIENRAVLGQGRKGKEMVGVKPNNTHCKHIQKCDNKSPLYKQYMLIKMFIYKNRVFFNIHQEKSCQTFMVAKANDLLLTGLKLKSSLP